MIPIPGAFFVVIFTMARLARMVIAGIPHHVTQRGNRREPIFFEEATRTFTEICSPSRRARLESRCGRTV